MEAVTAWYLGTRIYDRKAREYGVVLRLAILLAFGRDWDRATRCARAAAAEVNAHLDADHPPRAVHHDVSWQSSTGAGEPSVATASVGCTYRLLVPRPSEIPTTLDAALALLGKRIDVAHTAAFAAKMAVAGAVKADEAHELEREAGRAASIVRHLREQVRETARAACRYEARLAGLQAELDAEAQTQARRIVELERQQPTPMADGSAVPAYVRAAAMAALPKACRNMGSMFRGLDSYDKPLVTVEDLARFKAQAEQDELDFALYGTGDGDR